MFFSRNYGYNIYAPPPPVPTIKYNFDAHIEVPVPAAQCLPLKGLVSQIDKIVLPKPGINYLFIVEFQFLYKNV